jgi:hypothetical protein
LHCERLEDRLVPSLANGTILIANAGISPWSSDGSNPVLAVNPSLGVNSYRSPLEKAGDGTVKSRADDSWSEVYPRAIIAVDPSTGTQSPVSTDGFLTLPTVVCQGPAPQDLLYVTDLEAFPSIEKDENGLPLVMGAVIAIDPNTGQQKVVARGTVMGADGQNHPDPTSYINGPNTLVFMNGYLYVADEGDASGTIHNIVQIDPSTGTQRLITDGSGGGFSVPVGLVAPSGAADFLYVADEPGNVQGTGPGAIWQVNLTTGQQTILSQGGLLGRPTDVAQDPSGNLVVATTGSASDDYAGSVVLVNTQTGAQTLITSFAADSGIDSVTVGRDGSIFVGAIGVGASPGQVIAVNPLTDVQRTVTSGGYLSLVEGMTVFQDDGNGGFMPPAASPSSNQAQTSNADGSPAGSLSVVTAQVEVVKPSFGPSPFGAGAGATEQAAGKKVVDSFFAHWPEEFVEDL